MTKHYDKELFGKRLKEVMKDNNDTTYSLAEYLNLKAPTISKYTNGKIKAKILTIKIIAEKYNVNPDWLQGVQGAEKYLRKPQTKKYKQTAGLSEFCHSYCSFNTGEGCPCLDDKNKCPIDYFLDWFIR